MQYETTARSIWLFYAADDGYSDGPDITKMLKDLEIKPNVPKQASVMLVEFKTQSWRALGSYIHGGKHPLKRKQDGYPFSLLIAISQQSTGLLLMAAMTVIAMSGDQKLADKYWKLQNEFKDCLSPYILKPT